MNRNQPTADQLRTSNERAQTYTQQLERCIDTLMTEKMELQIKVSLLSDQLREQSYMIEQLIRRSIQ